jgi:hypothetical protein
MKRRDLLLSNFALAERHVLEGRENVARQRALVARLKEAGHDVADSQQLLEQKVNPLCSARR